MDDLPGALQPLAAYRQFVTYRLVPSAKPGKTDKLPCDHATGYVANAHAPTIRTDFVTAAAAVAAGRGHGVGFVFTDDDPFWFLDIDGALQADNTWSPLAQQLCAALPGAAIEVSQSGRGLHIIGSGAVPPHGCKNIPLGLEFYDSLRFVALTGVGAVGSAATDCTQALTALVPHYFPLGAAATVGPDEWTTEPVPEWDGPTDDDELIRRALASGARSAAVAFGCDAGVTFRDLWEANADALARRWPGDNGPYDASSADASLAAHLAFWTGKNCERIRDLMYRSGLVRDKWELRGDYYLPRTILRACAVSAEVAKGKSEPLPAQPDSGCYPGSLSPPGQPPTEESLAREFVAMHGDHWRFDHTRQTWLRWDGKSWAHDECRLIRHVISEHLREAGAFGFKPQIANARTVAGVEKLASSNPAIAATSALWDSDGWLLGTTSGTVDLQTGRLHEGTPGEYITRLTAVGPSDGQATQWLRFLNEATANDQDQVGFLQRWCGYCLTGSTREHAFAFIYGPGGNGKSVFLNTVAGILGGYAETATMETFADSRHDRHSTELAMLNGARLVTASETEQGRGWAEAKVKAITGGDPITARFMRQDNFTFRPQFKLMIAGNHAPSLRNVDEAMRRRLNILPFVVKPAQPDAQLESKLREEWPQILAWMIAGCLDWQAKGLRRPDAVAGATERYFADQDTFGQWLEEKCETGNNFTAQPTPLFQSWSLYAQSTGELAGTQKDFKSTLERRGFVGARSNGARIYRGIRLRELQTGTGGTPRDAFSL